MHWKEIETLGKQKHKILDMIQKHFQNSQAIPFAGIEGLKEISIELESIKEQSGLDLISLVEKYKLEREENGGAHALTTEERTKIVFPDPENNYTT